LSSSLKIIFAGSGEFGLPTLRAVRSAGHEIVQLFTQPDRPAGRGRKLTATPIGQYAIDQSLPLVRTANINTEQLPAADVMVVIAFGQKIADNVVNYPRLGSVNLHASRLPKYRGAAPINAAILAGETISGNSIIRLAQKMDAGAVLGQSSIEIGELETAGELHDRLADDGAPLMIAVLSALGEGIAIETVQDESAATIAPKMSRASAAIDWSHSAEQIARKVRGLYPWPGCRVRLIDIEQNEVDRLTLVRARPARSGSSRPPSEITDRLTVIAGDAFEVEIVQVQPEGKRPMPLSAYRNGHRWECGMRLESIT
jgi:methionyl-tRNA formyltransferase